MIGALLVEVAKANADQLIENFDAVPVGRVVENPAITINTGGMTISPPMEELVSVWEKPFQEAAR